MFIYLRVKLYKGKGLGDIRVTHHACYNSLSLHGSPHKTFFG